MAPQDCTQCPNHEAMAQRVNWLEDNVAALREDMETMKPLAATIKVLATAVWGVCLALISLVLVAIFWGGRIDNAVITQKESISVMQTDLKQLTRDTYHNRSNK